MPYIAPLEAVSYCRAYPKQNAKESSVPKLLPILTLTLAFLLTASASHANRDGVAVGPACAAQVKKSVARHAQCLLKAEAHGDLTQKSAARKQRKTRKCDAQFDRNLERILKKSPDGSCQALSADQLRHETETYVKLIGNTAQAIQNPPMPILDTSELPDCSKDNAAAILTKGGCRLAPGTSLHFNVADCPDLEEGDTTAVCTPDSRADRLPFAYSLGEPQDPDYFCLETPNKDNCAGTAPKSFTAECASGFAEHSSDDPFGMLLCRPNAVAVCSYQSGDDYPTCTNGMVLYPTCKYQVNTINPPLQIEIQEMTPDTIQCDGQVVIDGKKQPGSVTFEPPVEIDGQPVGASPLNEIYFVRCDAGAGNSQWEKMSTEQGNQGYRCSTTTGSN